MSRKIICKANFPCNSICLIIGVLLHSQAPAADICLMLTPAEQQILYQAQQKDSFSRAKAKTVSLTLNGIIFHSTTSWTIWLNKLSISYREYNKAFTIIKVMPDSVELIWKPDLQRQHHILLQTGETFVVDK